MIKLATTSHCPKCMAIKTILRNKKLEYEEVNSETVIDELTRDNIYSLPAILIDNHWCPVNSETLQKAAER